MLFRESGAVGLAISQPSHAFISGQILAEWSAALPRSLVLAAGQHDLAWLDWERRPPFDGRTGRPPLFRSVGAATHAPMWADGVDRALAAWGAFPALMISRHGGVIYRRFADRHRLDPDDAAAAEHYLAEQASREATWATALGLGDDDLARFSDLIAFADTLSLVFCGELAAPAEIEAPGFGPISVRAEDDALSSFSLSPWPFRSDGVRFEAEARRLPPARRFPDEAAMRSWLADATTFVRFEVTARNLN